MNVELKALLLLVFDGLNLAEDAIAKKNFILLLPDLYQLAMDIAPAVSNWSDLQPEIAALPGSAQEADLVAFIQQKFNLAVGSPKAQAILSAVLKLIEDVAQDALVLQSALKA